MQIARTAMLAAFLAGAGTVTAEAAELRLDADQLDTVSAGMPMPRGNMLQQLPAILDAYGYGGAFNGIDLGGSVGRVGGGLGSIGAIGGRLGGIGGGFSLPLGLLTMR